MTVGLLIERLRKIFASQTVTRFSITFIILGMVITSPILMLVSPTQVSAATAAGNPNGIDTSAYHSNMPTTTSSTPTSTMKQGGDFTAQAALTLTRAAQTSNFVASKAYYDISFRTATAGVIKSVVMDFPTGTAVGSALIVEAVGIGPGTLAASAGEVLTYTVTNAVNVPALTNIRIQISNINNPSTPGASFTVSITTRDAAATPIDGPTPTQAYNMVQVGNAQIAPGAVTTTKIASGAVTSGDLANDAVTTEKIAFSAVTSGEIANDAVTDQEVAPSFVKNGFLIDGSPGWNPNGVTTVFEIPEIEVFDSAVVVNVDSEIAADPVCSASGSTGEIEITCTSPPADGSELHYAVINGPFG